MNLQARTLNDVLSLEESYERRSEYIRFANSIDLHPAEIEWLYNRHYYIVQYKKIYEIRFSKNYKGNYYSSLLYKSEDALTKRGRFAYGDAKTVNRWLGFNLLKEN